ncbi:MBL fold metallo-hydrolase [Sulfurospirillum sp. 1307]|jgi:glyoxylase-like metal-dependent hydrolase (beta-lactamase superfamily II)
MKKMFYLLVFPIVLFAKFFTFEPVNITKDISCVIGDYNPVLKSNKGFVSNVCYVDMGDFLVLLDSGATYNFAKELDEFIHKNTSKPIKYVVVTNYHDDRLLGSSYFKEKGVKVTGAENLNETIDEHKEKYKRVLDNLPSDLIKNTKIVYADIGVKDEYVINGKNKDLKIIKPSEGSQSATDLIVYSPKDSFVFAGNIIFNGRFVNYASDSNMDGWIKALESIENLKAKFVLGGHGDDFSKDSYKPTLEYLKMLKKQVSIAYEKDIDPADLSKNIKTDKFKSIPHYDELYMRNARNYFDQLEWQ